jgi:hypothetical protein
LSYDQRPGKLRVVSDGGAAQRRASDPVTIDGNAVTIAGGDAATAGAVAAGAPGAIPAKAGLPLFSAALFLVACAASGVIVALVRPFGLH